MSSASFIAKDEIRRRFASAMDSMYRAEIPAYSSMVGMVTGVNEQAKDTAHGDLELREDLTQTRHGAIRLGSAEELSMVRRVFAVMGMDAVSYYDLSAAGLPVHSTAFRATRRSSLIYCPFRMFVSLLRLDLIDDPSLRKDAQSAIVRRKIFSDSAINLVKKAETNKGLDESDTEAFVEAVLETFRWRPEAQVSLETYERLLAAHGLIADVVSFPGPHINHLTRPTWDIDQTQARMSDCEVEPKAFVEGPPRRKCPILLRQTAFRAVAEDAQFRNHNGAVSTRKHVARFGEIESRGIALTPKGRELYDELLAEALVNSKQGEDYTLALQEAFSRFPDDWDTLRREKFAYFEYGVTDKGLEASQNGDLESDLDQLLEDGHVDVTPIMYEDFLPVSAAGIFRSNLTTQQKNNFDAQSNQVLFEDQLGAKIIDPFTLYESQQNQSLESCFARLESSGRTAT